MLLAQSCFVDTCTGFHASTRCLCALPFALLALQCSGACSWDIWYDCHITLTDRILDHDYGLGHRYNNRHGPFLGYGDNWSLKLDAWMVHWILQEVDQFEKQESVTKKHYCCLGSVKSSLFKGSNTGGLPPFLFCGWAELEFKVLNGVRPQRMSTWGQPMPTSLQKPLQSFYTLSEVLKAHCHWVADIVPFHLNILWKKMDKTVLRIRI